MKNNKLFENYLKSLEQKYNAACFDIDGTLTTKNSKIIDSRAVEMIIKLLRKKIPVVFITGRGEIGLNDLKNDIYIHVRNSKDITDNDIKRIYALTNDGARLFYSKDINQNDFLKESMYISTEEELNHLTIINKLIMKIKDNSIYRNYFNITYSVDSKTNKIINIRLVFNNGNEKVADLILNDIANYIKNGGLCVYLTRGIYKDKPVIQIGTATKDIAIERTERLIGVPKDSMIRIGDCGDLRGNDYTMLNCKQGYSVDKTCNSLNSCFPVFDKYGNILKGVEATLHLIENANILPTVCLEKADQDNYQHEFAMVEQSIVSGRKKLLKKYNDIISVNFNGCSGIDDLFDKFSGSVVVPMYEMELLNDSPLKTFWLTQNDGNQIYSIRDNNNYLLRGSGAYYYFISNRISNNGTDVTTKSNVINWYENYIKFFESSKKSVLATDDLNYEINKKLLLGILDNCRNSLLILLNHFLVSNYFNESVLVDISSNEKKEVTELYKALMITEKVFSKICFEIGYIIDKKDIVECIDNVKRILTNNLKIELESKDKGDYSKDYRAYREIDNFAENYIAVSLYKEKSNIDTSKNVCGLSYGGIELPILSKIINENGVERLLILKFGKNVSGYTNKQLIDLRNFNINKYGGLMNCDILENSNVDLFDDNVLTGKTLQLAVNSLYDCNINVSNICIVRYPSINRIDQMFFNSPSAIDYHLFFDYIYGLCFSSPYSWKDDNWKIENGKIDYTDTLGVFDLNRKKIIECLIKNHDFNQNSEVGEYRRRLLK